MILAVTHEVLPKKIKEIAEKCSIPPEQVIDIFEAMGGPDLTEPNYFLFDQVHPCAVGYFHLAENLADAIGLPLLPLGQKSGSLEKQAWLEHIGHVDYKYYLQSDEGKNEDGSLKDGFVLSHCNGDISLQGQASGDGEHFQLHIAEFNLLAKGSQDFSFFLSGFGDEEGKYLSHANA